MTISFNGNPTADIFTRVYDVNEGLIETCEKQNVLIGPYGNIYGYEIANVSGYNRLKEKHELFDLTTVEKCQEVIRSIMKRTKGYELKSYYENPGLNLQKILTLKLAENEIVPTEGECIIAMLLEGYEAIFFEKNKITGNPSAHCRFKATLITKKK